MTDSHVYKDLEYEALTPAEVLSKAQEEAKNIKHLHENLDRWMRQIEQLDGWREGEGPEEPRRGPRNDYLVQLLHHMQSLHTKAVERLNRLAQEAPTKLEHYHVAGLLEMAEEAESLRKDLHSTVLPMHVRAFSEVDEFLGYSESSLQYHTVRRSELPEAFR